MGNREIDVLLANMESLMNQQRYAEAIYIGQTLLTRLVTSTPANRALVRYNIGTCYNELGQFAEAESNYEDSIQDNPDDTDTWFNHVRNQATWAAHARRAGDMSTYGIHVRMAYRLLLEAESHHMSLSDSATLHEILDRL